MQILVFVLLATFWWIYNLVKNKINRFKDKGQVVVDETRGYHSKGRRQFKPLPAVESRQQPKLDFDNPRLVGRPRAGKELHKRKMKDLDSGMELLELGFLLGIIENTEASDETDLVMRKLGFNELLRRGKLERVSSYALKTYAINQGNLYGTDIQCEAIKELAERTSQNN